MFSGSLKLFLHCRFCSQEITTHSLTAMLVMTVVFFNFALRLAPLRFRQPESNIEALLNKITTHCSLKKVLRIPRLFDYNRTIYELRKFTQ